MISLEQKYQKKTDKEHVLDNPGTYTGSMEPSDFCGVPTVTKM